MQLHDVRVKAAELGADLPDDLIAIDLAVSAFKLHPMQRPKISKMLARGAELDYLIYWRQDRFVRRLFPDFANMIAWASKHGVKLISATEQLGDPTVYAEQMVPVLRAWLGEGENRSIQERTGCELPSGREAVIALVGVSGSRAGDLRDCRSFRTSRCAGIVCRRVRLLPRAGPDVVRRRDQERAAVPGELTRVCCSAAGVGSTSGSG